MARLVAGRQWAVGSAFTRGDIAVGTATAYVSPRFAEVSWRGQHPELAQFADRLALRESFNYTLPVAQVISERMMQDV